MGELRDHLAFAHPRGHAHADQRFRRGSNCSMAEESGAVRGPLWGRSHQDLSDRVDGAAALLPGARLGRMGLLSDESFPACLRHP